MSIRELYETFRNDRESIALVAYDVPLSVAAVESDGVISGPPARSLTGATGAVGVCLVDTGVDTAVPAVASAFVGGYDFIEDDTTPQDVHGHGTLMADAILTVAPGAQLYVAKVLNNSGDGFASDVIKGIDWCMTQDVSVISLSLGGGDFAGWCDASVLAMKANEAAARGFAVVAAAGNDGPTQMDSPACGSSVLSVAGTTKNDTVWSSSALTSVTDVFAPSVAVSLTGIGGEERIASGTSAGAAFTAGAVAVLLENEPLTSNEVVDRFRSTGVLIGTAVGDVPRINLLAAVTNATTGFDPTQTGGYVEGDIGYVSASICIDEGSGCFSDPECTQSHCSGSQAGEPCNFNGCFTTCSYTNELGSGGNCGQLCNSYCTVTGSFAQCESAPAGTEGNDCSICQECDGAGSCVNIASGTSDNGGSDLCRATAVGCEFGTCQCDGSGNCDIATGSQCSFGSQCVSGTCKDNVYQGSVTTDRCVGDNSWCVGTSNSYASGTTVGDSVCRGSVSGGSVWLASSGRYEVRNTTGSVLAVLDKYGSFGIRGSPTWSTGSFDNGWQVQDSGAVTRFSINSANGNLRAASTLTTRTTPSGTGFRVQNTTGSLQGIITTAGAVALRGDFAYSLTTLS